MGRSGSRKTRQALFSGNANILGPSNIRIIDLSKDGSLRLIQSKRQQSIDNQILTPLKSKFISSLNINSIDFDGLDLSSSDFSNLSGDSLNFGNSDEDLASKMIAVNFSGANISLSNFSNCNLSNANLKRAVMTDSCFDQVNFSGADMTRTIFDGSGFLNLLPWSLNGDIQETSFKRAIFSHCLNPFSRDQKIHSIDFHLAQFKETVFETRSCFKESDFSNSKWDKTSCQSADFSWTSFKEAEISDSYFNDSNFSSVEFNSASVKNSKFFKANFKEANLSGSVFIETDFREAEFPYANIDKTVFKKCIFSKSFAKAVFKGSSYTTVTVPDLTEAMNFDQALFIDCIIESD